MIDVHAVQSRLADLAATFKAYLELSQKGKTKITKGDKRRIREFESTFRLILDPEPRSDLLVDVHGVAAFFGVAVRTVQSWTRRGCPKLKHGLYDLKTFYDWWVETFTKGDDSAIIEDVKLEYWREKTLRERMKRQQEEHSLIPKAHAEALQAETVQVTVASLQNWKNRLPPLFEAKSRAVIADILDREIHEFRERMHRVGSYN